jgi:hypothetical protein
LEDAGIPARVIDELMGHEATSRSGQQRGSAMGARYRHTTPEMAARIATAIEQRLTVVLEIAEQASAPPEPLNPESVLANASRVSDKSLANGAQSGARRCVVPGGEQLVGRHRQFARAVGGPHPRPLDRHPAATQGHRAPLVAVAHRCATETCSGMGQSRHAGLDIRRLVLPAHGPLPRGALGGSPETYQTAGSDGDRHLKIYESRDNLPEAVGYTPAILATRIPEVGSAGGIELPRGQARGGRPASLAHAMIALDRDHGRAPASCWHVSDQRHNLSVFCDTNLPDQGRDQAVCHP